MKALITGSFAYDTIMVFPDHFKNHILPDQVHILNVAFLVPELRREFGGCAANIAYNLKLLGEDPLPMATVGSNDFAPYKAWLNKIGIDHRFVSEIEDSYTAQAFLTTDKDNNQIIAFHPGAMSFAHRNSVTGIEDISLGVVAPDGRDAMIEHAKQFVDAGIDFMFDPGQGLPMFDGDDLKTFIQQATYVVVNDYESQMLIDKTGLSLSEIAAMVDTLIVTRGAKGSEIYNAGKAHHIDAIKVTDTKDPTGCGDAFRAGLIYGIMHGLDWQTSGQLASVLGGMKIETHGTQNHSPSIEEIEARYSENFSGSFR